VSEPADPVVIGIVASPHGVRGTVKVREVGSGRHLREGIEPLVGDRRRRILTSRHTGKGYLLDLEGLESREDAVSVRGSELILDRSELDEPDDDEYYVSDLIGLQARDLNGAPIGTVEDLLQNAGNELLIIRSQEDGTIYVPFTAEHVPTVDIAGGVVVVDPPRE
jgi:16S rRNA processing protein RimM